MNKEKMIELFSLKGQVAIVTGGAGRLGYQHIKALNYAGATPISFDIIQNPKLADIAESQMIVDITNQKDVKKAVDLVVSKYDGIDILINNAAFNPKVGKDADKTGYDCWAPHELYSEALWKKEFDIGLNGAHFCTQAVAKYMIQQNSGSVINIASTSAITAPSHKKYKPGKFKSAAYPVVKTALLGLTRSWASYFASVASRVRVNAVCFGAVNFGSMEPEFVKKLGSRNMLGRPAQPDEYQGILIFLCSKAASFITGSTLIADAGQTAW
ncbi:MAG: SDR family oxidoreductase [Patescibacteria group bacterium]